MEDVVIVGAGPAGLTAALYTGRSRLKTKVIERLEVGGQVLLTDMIENFPGVYQMNSRAWVETVKKQLGDLKDVEIREGMRVEQVECLDGIFKTHMVCELEHRKEVLESHCVILATGALPRRLGIKGEASLTGRGVSYCATCDGPLFKDSEIVVVGGGNTALEEALFLTKFAKKVTVVHRRSSLRAAVVLQERARANEKIVFKWNSTPVEILGEKRVEGLKIANVRTNREEVLACDGVFVFVGFTPETGFLKGLMDLNESGCIITDENLESTCTGIFAVGDCRARPLNQIVTACSDGAIAAYAVTKFLENKI
jgi:thioredoxin reductase (NADPH)